MQATYPIAKDLVLVGGGHSHVVLLRMLAMQPMPGLQITLISPDTSTPYSGMLPGVIAGHYEPDDIHIDLVPLCRFAGARFIQARVEDFDPYGRTIALPGRPAVSYDVLSLDIGITPALDTPGADGRVIPVKPIGGFLARWEAFKPRALAGQVSRIGVVGGGAGGVELVFAIRHWLRSVGVLAEVHLITAESALLKGYPESVRTRFERLLSREGIFVHEDFRVEAVTSEGVQNRAVTLPLEDIFWVTSAASQEWLKKTGLDLDADGFIKVTDTLQSTSFPDVFASGDIASMVGHPRPKAGVYAVRQGPALYRNIRHYLLEKKLRKYRPQHSFLSLVSTGNRHAVASKLRFSAEGGWVWRWKDWIDRRFMRRFDDLPPMAPDRAPPLLKHFDQQMHCGGCGSKVSAQLLSDVLREAGLKSSELDDAALFDCPAGYTMLHTVDAFQPFVDDPYTFARIAVHHALSDIYAMGGQPVTALAIISVPYGTPAKIRSNLEQLIAGSLEVLNQEGVSLVGGHTTEASELSLGFAVNGLVKSDDVMRKRCKPGQCLVLTKPLGTGVLFAADMQWRARGEWIATALDTMNTSNRAAMQVFLDHAVHACTDVTGFGIAGHLLEMLRPTKLSALLQLDTLPLLPGAASVFHELGIHSTLQEGNQAAAPEVEPSTHQNYPLLFDPQTSGGLLAAVDENEVQQVLADLKAAGVVDAAMIGRVIDSGSVRISFE